MVKRNKILCILGLLSFLFIGLYGCNKESATQSTTTIATQSDTSEIAATDATTDTTTNTLVQGDYIISITSNNSWESNGMTCAQFDGVIKNQSEELGKDWKVMITVPEDSVLENGWNGVYNLDGTVLEITPVDYNTEIAAGTEISFGFILDTKTSFSPENVILDIAGGTYAMGEGVIQTTQQQETTTEQHTVEATEALSDNVTGTPFENHGVLSVKGTDIVDEDGNIYQLKGVSTHGINWFPDYVNKDAFADLAKYGVNAIRLAMYTADYNGYCNGGNQEELENVIDRGVQACTELGLYVIVDWHILSDNDPNQNKESAKLFFDKISKKYSDCENVIYEICNEPNGGTSWESIKAYAEEVIPVIRKNNKNAIIIVGTPNWSQDVDIASQNPITGQENIIYATHFYASTHKDEIRNKLKAARENGLPVIISECSICEASGNGSINYDEASFWMEMINEYKISCFAWNLSNKDEQSSFLKPSVTKTSGFSKDDFTETGMWFLEQFSQ